MKLRPALPILALILLAAPPSLADEQTQLVHRGRAEADALWRRGFTLGDSSLDGQLQGMLDTLTAGEPRPQGVELHVHVFRSPEINAFAMPDGSIFVFAGLIAELTTRDQLAFVLRHEAEHALGGHAARDVSHAKKEIGVFSVLSLASSVLVGSALVNSFTQLGLQLAADYSVNGYGRGLEREADLAAARRLAASRFDSCGAIESLEMIRLRTKEPGRVENFFWGNHPKLEARIGYVREVAGGGACPFDSTRIGAGYAEIKWPMMKLTAGLWTAAGDRGKALRCAEAYRAARPEDPDAQLLLGDAYAASDSADTLRLASGAYQRALELAKSDYRPPLRGLALVAEKQRDTTSCIGYLERYLSGAGSLRDRRSLTRKLEAMKSAISGRAGSIPDTSATVQKGPRSGQ